MRVRSDQRHVKQLAEGVETKVLNHGGGGARCEVLWAGQSVRFGEWGGRGDGGGRAAVKQNKSNTRGGGGRLTWIHGSLVTPCRSARVRHLSWCTLRKSTFGFLRATWRLRLSSERHASHDGEKKWTHTSRPLLRAARIAA